MAEQSSWVPLPCYSLPRSSFPVKSVALAAPAFPRTIHFQVLDKSPLLGPGRGPPSRNTNRLFPLTANKEKKIHPQFQTSSRFPLRLKQKPNALFWLAKGELSLPGFSPPLLQPCSCLSFLIFHPPPRHTQPLPHSQSAHLGAAPPPGLSIHKGPGFWTKGPSPTSLAL